MKLLQVSQAFLRGLGQIMLQPSAVTGLLFLIGIAVNSPSQAVGAMVGGATGYVYGRIVASKSEWLSEGLFGFNAALVGLATCVLFESSGLAMVLLVGGALGASVVMHVFLLRELPAYTAPFVLASWMVAAIGHHGLHLHAREAAETMRLLPDLPGAPFAGIGQVMFQGEALSGMLFLLGIIFCPIMRKGWHGGRILALRQGTWTFIGALIAGGLASVMGESSVTVNLGLYGFNGALAALAVSLNRPGWCPPAAFALVTVPIMFAFRSAGLPAFTAPFVIATWLSHGVLRKENHRVH